MVERVEQSGYLSSSARSPAQGLKTYQLAKRALDLAIAIPGLLLAVPLAILIGLALKLDTPGPVLFRQERIGRFGKTFRILKFRTMYWPPRPDFHQEHVNQNANGSAKKARQLRIPEDPRITRVGRLLRKWSLDELPNLWNVIVGVMSLVGPRPLVPYEAEVLDEEAKLRFTVKPGITGLAQVNGRLDVSIHARSDLDLTYVRNQSLRNDLMILAQTPFALLTRRGL